MFLFKRKRGPGDPESSEELVVITVGNFDSLIQQSLSFGYIEVWDEEDVLLFSLKLVELDGEVVVSDKYLLGLNIADDTVNNAMTRIKNDPEAKRVLIFPALIQKFRIYEVIRPEAPEPSV